MKNHCLELNRVLNIEITAFKEIMVVAYCRRMIMMMTTSL